MAMTVTNFRADALWAKNSERIVVSMKKISKNSTKKNSMWAGKLRSCLQERKNRIASKESTALPMRYESPVKVKINAILRDCAWYRVNNVGGDKRFFELLSCQLSCFAIDIRCSCRGIYNACPPRQKSSRNAGQGVPCPALAHVRRTRIIQQDMRAVCNDVYLYLYQQCCAEILSNCLHLLYPLFMGQRPDISSSQQCKLKRIGGQKKWLS